MDMSEQALGVCRKQGFSVHQGIDPTAVFESGSFDVVSLWHVIEHVPSPTATLRQMHDILAEKGKLVLVMPNIGSTLACWFGIYWFPMELPRHFNHFNRVTIANMLEKCGFQVELIRGQKHGRVFQKSMQYVGREKKGFYAWLARRKRLCSWVEHLVDFWGEPSVLMVQARKTPKK
jgi:SAM-dependent methyltransferase